VSPYDDPHVSAGEIADYLHSQQAQPMDLLPCPFCSVVPEVLPLLCHGFYVECENPDCPTKPETRGFDTEEQAVQPSGNVVYVNLYF
jgi:hypothetical protein